MSFSRIFIGSCQKTLAILTRFAARQRRRFAKMRRADFSSGRAFPKTAAIQEAFGVPETSSLSLIYAVYERRGVQSLGQGMVTAYDATKNGMGAAFKAVGAYFVTY